MTGRRKMESNLAQIRIPWLFNICLANDVALFVVITQLAFYKA